MKEEPKNEYQEEKAKKEFLIFDRGLSELTVNKYKEKEIKQKINWFTLYKILFKNILNSKDVIPLDELILRFNIIRTSLPKYYKGYKGNDSNSSAIIKKFTYHICKNKKKNKNLLKLRQKSEERTNNFKLENKLSTDGGLSFRKRSEKKTKTVKVTHKLNFEFLNSNKSNKSNKNNNLIPSPKGSQLEVLVENDDLSVEDRKKNELVNKYDLPNLQVKNNNKKLTVSGRIQNKTINRILNTNTNANTNTHQQTESKKRVKINVNNNNLTNSSRVKISNNINMDNSKDDNNEGNGIILGTPTDSEFPLVLSQKRTYNTKPSFFFESLNKIKELTKQEKIKTFQKEFTSQILKFNDLYFDPKIDDFYNDKLFNDVKATCDLFINKFNIDSEEEKNLADLDNYL